MRCKLLLSALLAAFSLVCLPHEPPAPAPAAPFLALSAFHISPYLNSFYSSAAASALPAPSIPKKAGALPSSAAPASLATSASFSCFFCHLLHLLLHLFLLFCSAPALLPQFPPLLQLQISTPSCCLGASNCALRFLSCARMQHAAHGTQQAALPTANLLPDAAHQLITPNPNPTPTPTPTAAGGTFVRASSWTTVGHNLVNW